MIETLVLQIVEALVQQVGVPFLVRALQGHVSGDDEKAALIDAERVTSKAIADAAAEKIIDG